jgi:hypothetical protein
MTHNGFRSSLCLGIFIFLGLSSLGYLLGSSAIRFKQLERTVTVKGLSERQLSADTAIWPIQFSCATNDITGLYDNLSRDGDMILDFLRKSGFQEKEITVGIPVIVDKLAQQYGGNARIQLRFTATQSITVCSNKVDLVRNTMKDLVELGKKGIVFSGSNYDNRPEFMFSRLNEIKPEMIEEATRKAREVALKFAKDSRSRLGKIKRASQGQFSIRSRDRNTPYIKKIRVVSTVEYYLAD